MLVSLRGLDNPDALLRAAVFQLTNDQAMVSDTKGGIDFNPNNMDLQTQGKGMDYDLPFDPKSFDGVTIHGFSPVIFKIVPIPDLPLLLGVKEEEEEPQLSRM